MKFLPVHPQAPPAELDPHRLSTVLAMAVCIFLFCTLQIRAGRR